MSFSTDIYLEANTPLPDGSVIGISMSKASSRGRRLNEYDDDEYSEEDKFTWETSSITSRELSVQMTFSDPLAVSSDASDPTELYFEVKNKYFFMTKDGGEPLDDKVEIKPQKVPKQFPSKEAAESMKKSAENAKAAMLTQLILTIILQIVF
jgi:hypothetical protein